MRIKTDNKELYDIFCDMLDKHKRGEKVSMKISSITEPMVINDEYIFDVEIEK